MKVKVNRLLSAGLYHINFVVGDFTSDEVAKMGSFGVPQIRLVWGIPGSRSTANVPLSRINQEYDSVFASEEEAKQYEETVLNQIRDSMKRLRESQDKFSSSDEVAL
jgi:hypothetical protein